MDDRSSAVLIHYMRGAHVDIKPLAGLAQSGETHQWIIDISRFLLPILKEAASS